MLTQAEIAQMRSLAEETFQSTCVIQAGTIASDSGGGGSATWAASGTVACHLAPILVRGEREGVESGRISSEADFIATLPADTTIDQKNRVVIDSVTYEVEAVRAPRTWELTRRVEVSRA